jgi:hypothetical protein
MAVENMQGDAKVSSANEHRKTSAGASKREVEHGRCKTNEQSKGCRIRSPFHQQRLPRMPEAEN